jgi:type I restriction enzyme M protein
MFEQAFKKIDDILRKDAGVSSELDYIEQTSWLLFLKYLDALEQDRAQIAELHGQPHTFLLEKPYRWHTWATPLTKNGSLDHNRAMIGDDLRDFVDLKLFPYLKDFKQRADRPDTIEYKIGEIFGELKNKFQSGYNLREVIELVDTLRFNSQTEKHELSDLYEAKIRNMDVSRRRSLGRAHAARKTNFLMQWSRGLTTGRSSTLSNFAESPVLRSRQA